MAAGLTRRAALLGGFAALTACGAESVWAPDAFVERSRYVHTGPPGIALYTVRNVGSDRGAHSGLLITAEERALFDPAGTFRNAALPERDDLIHGMSPRALEIYINYHTRITYYTVEQSLDLPLPVASALLARAKAAGPVPKAMCTRSISALLRETPGLGSIRQTWFPEFLSEQFAELPGVRTRRYVDDDSHDNSMILLEML
ncbi:MAG: hypothetical protein AAF330_06760 [Pseudomonadota bacterium]